MLIKINGILILSLLLTACGGGDSTEESPVLPRLTVDSPAISEGNSGVTVLGFSVSLNKADSTDVSVDFATADDSASAASDYLATNGRLTIAAGSTSATFEITISGDIDVENDETFSVNLSNISSNATLVTTTATGTILNDDVTVIPPISSSSSLNDTGVTMCSDDFVIGLNCNDSGEGTDQFPGQDAEYGRDNTDNDDSDGQAGFIFSKLDSNGNPLGDQSADYTTTIWSCVEDGITGLTWEVKTDDNGLHDRDWNYSWFDSNSSSIPSISNGGQCNSARNCDTEKFTEAVNDSQLCGFDDWRLPTRHELISLMYFGATTAPYIDTKYFVNHAPFPHWSSSSTPGFQAAYVYYSEDGAGAAMTIENFSVRLVRGGE